jgi:hypothetical protein
MKTKEEILNEYGCPEIPFNENVEMFYSAILGAMEEYAKEYHKEQMRIKDHCIPPNITYCKLEIYPDFDCNTCKWRAKL